MHTKAPNPLLSSRYGKETPQSTLFCKVTRRSEGLGERPRLLRGWESVLDYSSEGRVFVCGMTKVNSPRTCPAAKRA
jgi:hypothetical protein